MHIVLCKEIVLQDCVDLKHDICSLLYYTYRLHSGVFKLDVLDVSLQGFVCCAALPTEWQILYRPVLTLHRFKTLLMPRMGVNVMLSNVVLLYFADRVHSEDCTKRWQGYWLASHARAEV